MAPETDPPIVGIGASAGGVNALQAFFSALPDEPNAAFVVIVHLDPAYRSELAGILASRTRMPVSQVQGSQHLRNNHVYVIAPNCRLQIADHMITALPFDEPRPLRAPINLFFRSLAEHHSDAFAVVLTGAGADGAVGVRAIKEAGGIVLVQDPSEAEYPSMPRSAIATEVADFVLPVADLAVRLVELLRAREHVPSDEVIDSDDDMLRRILALLRVRVGHDFSQYKRATVVRRIARRALVTRRATLAEYYEYLRENPEEAPILFADLLISVTTFFRDRAAFETFARMVVPRLFDDKDDVTDTIRVWVPGCATGEEAYSIGMLLIEEATKRDVRPEIQVFGSDLDDDALAVAREGRYPVTIEADVSEDRLRRFFQREGDHYRVRRELRDIILFANHSLLRDPPFSRLDMVSCRNLLIYLDRDLQQQVFTTFHYALVQGGYLFLGASELADQPPGLFNTIDRDAKIYRATVAGRDHRRGGLPMLLGPRRFLAQTPPVIPVPRATSVAASTNDAAVHRQVLETVGPPSMLVNSGHRAIHLSENAGRFLQPSGGPVTADAADMVRSELRFELRAALHRAFERGEASLSLPLLVQFNGSRHRVFLQVRPLVRDGDPARYALVFFIEGEAVEQTESDALPDQLDAAGETVRQLRDDLQLSQTRLRVTREEAEGTNEELRAANEELQSINEEYRSTSEELETSKEELQSINEELQTVNNELKLKLESVSRAHSDLQNLMAAVDFGTLFLDTALRIKRFTPRLTELFNVAVSDEGRPITDFTHQLDYDGLAADARAVLNDHTTIEHEVRGTKGGWYRVRIRPYRTIDDKIDGVVVTFIDISERLAAESALRASEARFQEEARLVDLSRSPVFVWDFDGGILQWNRGSEELYGYTREETVGRPQQEVLKTTVPGSSFEELKQALLRDGLWSGEVLHRTKFDRELTVETRIELVSIDGRLLVLESTRDITEQKRWDERRQLIVRELGHRVSNSLAVVQSMARQMLSSMHSPAEFVEVFESRLTALALAHKLMIDTNWEGIDLESMARGQLAAYDRRLTIAGPAVKLPAELGTPLGLVLHELATNAVKYGALSAVDGRVHLSWTLRDNTLHLTWAESGGPVVKAPEKSGFGGTLIERGLPGADVKREYRPTGLICTIEVSLTEDPDDGAR